MRIRLRIVKSNTDPKHRETKKFRPLDPEFRSVGHALCALINYIAGLTCNWIRIDFQLIRGEEEGGGERKNQRL